MQTPALFRASAPSSTVQNLLGPLTDLPGTWMGKGFNLVSLPDKPDENKTFRLKLNAFNETLTFSTSIGEIPNRGFVQPDISIFGVSYLQQISDAVTNEGLHIEPGLWLLLPTDTTDPVNPPWNWTIARMGTIPHGDALMAQGPYKTEATRPFINIVDSTPFKLDAAGNRVNLTDADYLAPFTTTALPPGIPLEAIANPNVLLSNAIAGQNIIETVVLAIDASPVGGINVPDHIPSNPNAIGNIANISFVTKNANANSFAAIFWIEKVQNPDHSVFLQLQYTQTVIFEFDGVKWPHISVATLIKR